MGVVGDRVRVSQVAVTAPRDVRGRQAIIKKLSQITDADLDVFVGKDGKTKFCGGILLKDLEPIVDRPDGAPDATAVYVSGAKDASMNGWYTKRFSYDAPIWMADRNTDFRYNREAYFYKNVSNGYFIYQEKVKTKQTIKRCTLIRNFRLGTKCDAIVYRDENKNCRHDDEPTTSSSHHIKKDVICVWYICSPDGTRRYRHRHPMNFINQLTRNNWKAYDRSAPKHLREVKVQNLRVVEYPN